MSTKVFCDKCEAEIPADTEYAEDLEIIGNPEDGSCPTLIHIGDLCSKCSTALVGIINRFKKGKI